MKINKETTIRPKWSEIGRKFNPSTFARDELNMLKTKPFQGLKVYFAASIMGGPEPDIELPWKIVRYVIDNGGDVLTEHVGARNKEERYTIFKRRLGYIPYESPLAPVVIRSLDMKWLSEASHMIALVDTPSHGVGMELQMAMLKPSLGFNVSPILCLRRSGTLDNLSLLIRGVTKKECPHFFIHSYSSFSDARLHVRAFLTATYSS